MPFRAGAQRHAPWIRESVSGSWLGWNWLPSNARAFQPGGDPIPWVLLLAVTPVVFAGRFEVRQTLSSDGRHFTSLLLGFGA